MFFSRNRFHAGRINFCMNVHIIFGAVGLYIVIEAFFVRRLRSSFVAPGVDIRENERGRGSRSNVHGFPNLI